MVFVKGQSPGFDRFFRIRFYHTYTHLFMVRQLPKQTDKARISLALDGELQDCELQVGRATEKDRVTHPPLTLASLPGSPCLAHSGERRRSFRKMLLPNALLFEKSELIEDSAGSRCIADPCASLPLAPKKSRPGIPGRHVAS